MSHTWGLRATLCHAINTSDQWSMESAVWNANFRRALQLQTEFVNLLPKKLMSAKYLNCKTKVQLFRSLLLSVLLYGSETWPEPTQSQRKRLEAFQMKCLRRLAGEPRVPCTIKVCRLPDKGGAAICGCTSKCGTERTGRLGPHAPRRPRVITECVSTFPKPW